MCTYAYRVTRLQRRNRTSDHPRALLQLTLSNLSLLEDAEVSLLY